MNIDKEIYMKRIRDDMIEVKYNGKTYIAYDWTDAFKWICEEEEINGR